MTAAFETAAAKARERRQVLRDTLNVTRRRLAPMQLAEDVLSRIDPDLSLLARLRAQVLGNRLLSLAVLAGAGWLAGPPRRHNAGPQRARHGGTTTRTTLKEKKNDSGQDHGEQRPVPGAGPGP